MSLSEYRLSIVQELTDVLEGCYSLIFMYILWKEKGVFKDINNTDGNSSADNDEDEVIINLTLCSSWCLANLASQMC